MALAAAVGHATGWSLAAPAATAFTTLNIGKRLANLPALRRSALLQLPPAQASEPRLLAGRSGVPGHRLPRQLQRPGAPQACASEIPRASPLARVAAIPRSPKVIGRSADLRQHLIELRGCQVLPLGPRRSHLSAASLVAPGMIERRPHSLISRHRPRLPGGSLFSTRAYNRPLRASLAAVLPGHHSATHNLRISLPTTQRMPCSTQSRRLNFTRPREPLLLKSRQGHHR